MSRLNLKPTRKPSPDEKIEITVRVQPGRGRNEMLDLDSLCQPRSRRRQMVKEDFYEAFKADEEAFASVKRFAAENNLESINEDLRKRTIHLSGTISNMERAFNTSLNYYEVKDKMDGRKQEIISHDEEIIIPEVLKGVVENIIGLSNTPFSTSGVISKNLKSASKKLKSASKKPKSVSKKLKSASKKPKSAGKKRKSASKKPKSTGKKRKSASKKSKSAKSTRRPGGYTGNQYAEFYNFPSDQTGGGQKIALIQLGGGFRKKDIDHYFSKLAKIPKPTINVHSVLHATNNPRSRDLKANAEVTMDIEVAGSAAPGASLEVYFAPGTDRGLLEAIVAATHDGCPIISISWGDLESTVSEQGKNAINNALQEAANLDSTVLCASGDFGSTGPPPEIGEAPRDSVLNIQFPASSPFALACGGTSVKIKDNKIQSEKVWNAIWAFFKKRMASGGGFSKGFGSSFQNLRPIYQKGVLPSLYSDQLNRGTPDISASAHPSRSGHLIRFQSKNEIGGGTSAAAPLLAALFARINEKIGDQGFVNGTLYRLASKRKTYRQILKGNNVIIKGVNSWKAGAKWNPCTGLGTPNGKKVLAGLEAFT